MGEYGYAVITGLIIICLCTVIICVLMIRQREERQKWKKIAADNYARGQDEASELLKATCDKIEQERQRLEEQSEKDLLVEIMLALGSYGRRLDRIDGKLRCISSYKTYIDDMNSRTQKLTQSFIALDSSVSATASAVSGLRKTIQQTGSEIQTLISQLSGMEELGQAVSGYSSELNQVELTLEYLQEKVASIVEEMKTVTVAYDQSPMKKLNTIEMEITGLNLLANSIRDTVSGLSEASEKLETKLRESADDSGFAAVSAKLDALSGEVGSVRSAVSDIQGRVDRLAEDAPGNKS